MGDNFLPYIVWNACILPSYFSDSLAGYRNLSWKLFFFRLLKVFLHCLLVSTVTVKKPCHSYSWTFVCHLFLPLGKLLRSSYTFYFEILQWSALRSPPFSHFAKYSMHLFNLKFMLFMSQKNSLIISSLLFSLSRTLLSCVFDLLDWSSDFLTSFSCSLSFGIFVDFL